MALYGVIGDLHGNIEALRAVLARLDARGVERLLCVGDVVGFNADSDACADILRARRALSVAGNHDLISVGRLGFRRCANKVAYSLRRTRGQLSAATLAYLASLPASLVLEDRILVVHAGIRDPEQYVVGPRQVLENAALLREEFPRARLCLYGHVHVQKAWEVSGNQVTELPAEATVRMRRDRLYFVNPGSVDAARRSEHKRAQFAVLDSGQNEIEFHGVAYDDAASEAKAEAGGYRIGPWTDRLYSLRRRLTGSP